MMVDIVKCIANSCNNVNLRVCLKTDNLTMKRISAIVQKIATVVTPKIKKGTGDVVIAW